MVEVNPNPPSTTPNHLSVQDWAVRLSTLHFTGTSYHIRHRLGKPVQLQSMEGVVRVTTLEPTSHIAQRSKREVETQPHRADEAADPGAQHLPTGMYPAIGHGVIRISVHFCVACEPCDPA